MANNEPEDFPGQHDQTRREEAIADAVRAADRIILDRSNGTVEETNYLTAAVAERFVQKVMAGVSSELSKHDLETRGPRRRQLSGFYLVHLYTDIAHDIKLVDAQTFNWINSERPDFSQSKTVFDMACPAPVRQRIIDRQQITEPGAFHPYVSEGTCELDRAMIAPPMIWDGAELKFDSVDAATEWLHSLDATLEFAGTFERKI